MARQRGGLGRNPFHQIAVAHDSEDAMVQQIGVALEPRLHHALRERHADPVRESLPQGTGGGLHAGRVAVFGMPRSLRSPLPESLELIHRKVELEQMEERIEEHRGVPRRKNEAIAVRPPGIAWIEPHVFRPEHVGHVGRAHGRPRMPGLRLLDRIRRQKFDRVDAELSLIDRGGGHGLLVDLISGTGACEIRCYYSPRQDGMATTQDGLGENA